MASNQEKMDALVKLAKGLGLTMPQIETAVKEAGKNLQKASDASKSAKKMRSGGMVKTKKMRGGGMMKTAAKKKMMRGGGMAKTAKKRMMRGGMAAKKKAR